MATDFTVTGAVFLSNRLSLDWSEGTDTGHLEASATDGVSFRGNYGYPQLNAHRHVELTLSRTTTGELIFIGRWWNTESGGGGEWVFRLTRSSQAQLEAEVTQLPHQTEGISAPVPPRLPLSEVTRRGMMALARELGPTDATRFVMQFTNGFGDYTADREELFAGQTVDQLADAIRKEAPAPPPAG